MRKRNYSHTIFLDILNVPVTFSLGTNYVERKEDIKIKLVRSNPLQKVALVSYYIFNLIMLSLCIHTECK